MTVEMVETLVIGGGQAGLAMSEHLGKRGLPHLIVERRRIAERWRSERWDSLVANGPAWHDRFPNMRFAEVDPDSFARADQIVAYFEAYARQISAPIRCGVEVKALRCRADKEGFLAETSDSVIEARNVVVATGPFQRPLMPGLAPAQAPVLQIHSASYRNPEQLPEGAVLVIGAGSSGVQIADELQRAGRTVYLAVGPHNRPPRRYRGRDYCWWLGVLGKWDVKTPGPGTEHVTIAVSGAHGGETIDFRRLAARGIVLLGRAEQYLDGVMRFAPDLAQNIERGDADYRSVLDEADAYAAREGLDLPEEPEARRIDPDPPCMTDPILELNLAQAGVGTIVWATGYGFDFDWIKMDLFDEKGRPKHQDGVSIVPGLYFLGLPWLRNRSSSFIWGVWRDAEILAGQVEERTRQLTTPAV
jgi:putative flavoprotein involved in K+ transport